MRKKVTKAVSLAYLKKRTCTLEELQATLVKLCELHNGLNDWIKELIASGRIKSTREVRDDRMNAPFDI